MATTAAAAAAAAAPAAKLDAAKLAKLLEVARELQGKMGDVLGEIDEVLAGKASIAEKLKQVEAAFDRAWCTRYAPGRERGYIWNYTRDRGNMKRLLKTLEADDIIQRAAVYVGNDDPFFTRARHSFPVFVSTINQHARAAEAPRLELAYEEPIPFACTHHPPCKSDAAHTSRLQRELRELR